MMGTSIIVCQDIEHIAARALDLLVSELGRAIDRRSEAHLALTGGSSAAALFGLLRDEPRARRVDWARVHVWQGDERFVPLDHPDSNWAGALRDWLHHDDGPGMPEAHLHPIPVAEAIEAGHDAAWAAARYGEEIDEALPRRHGLPAFDVILLGVGGDGHILSTFPGTDPILETGRRAMAVPAPTHIEPHVERVTLVPHLLVAAGQIVAMVPGEAKAEVVAACLGPVRDPVRWPAQLALRPGAIWLLEPGSASAI